MHATHNALKVSSRKGCESALETRLRVSWPLSERSEPFMARFRVLGCVAKKRTRGKGDSKNPRTTSKCFRYAVCGESGSRGWYTLRTMDKRFSGAGLGCLWGVLRHPPKGGPRTENHFLKVVVCHFWRKRRRVKDLQLKMRKIVRNFTKSLHFGRGSGTLYP